MRVGSTIAERYRLVSEIGSGDACRVYFASDLLLERPVAVKFFLLGPGSGRARAGIEEAIASSARFHHAGLVTVLDSGFESGLYVVSEFCSGGSLADEIAYNGALAPKRAISIFRDASDVVASAHRQGLLHLGLKASNILFDNEGRTRVSDFALAPALAEGLGRSEIFSAVIGPSAAPEQINGEAAGTETDVYSLGIVMASALAGSQVIIRNGELVAIAESSYRPTRPLSLSGELGLIITRATRPEPSERFPDAEAFREALERLTDDDAEREEAALVGAGAVITRSALSPQRSAPFGFVGEGLPTETGAGSDVALLDLPPGLHEADDLSTIAGPPAGGADGWPYAIRGGALADATEVAFELPDDDPNERGLLRTESGHEDGEDELSSGIQEVTSSKKVKRRRRWPAFLVIAISLILLAAGAAVAVARTPSLLGMNIDAARSSAREHGLRVEIVQEQPRGDWEAGTVISQQPAPGGLLAPWQRARLVVSAGPPPVAVPEVTGLRMAEAAAEISTKGLVPVVSAYSFGSAMPGQVLSQDPRDGKAPGGSSVFLTVSAGPEPRAIPDLAGRPKADSEAALRDAGFEPTFKQDFSESVKAGTVIGLNPSSGTRARPGYPVIVTVSKGPQTVPLPDVRGSRVTDATSKLQALGIVVKLVQIVGQEKVVAMDPSPGTPVRKGATVTLTTGP